MIVLEIKVDNCFLKWWCIFVLTDGLRSLPILYPILIQNSESNFWFFKIRLLLVFSSNYDHVLIHYINYMSNSLISLDFKFIFIRIKSTVNYFEKLNFNINLRFLSGKKWSFLKLETIYNYTLSSLVLWYILRTVQIVILKIILCKSNCGTNSTLK